MTAKQAILAASLAAGLIVAGVAMLTGPAWALITAGAFGQAFVVLLYDPASRQHGRRRP
ncbi:hypothetical protein [Mycobacterium xenopi]|uniref:hypothetical protein n=1 Tax=Mycobacterium xenopi TaxID=1789 RepID=UPI000D89FB47|nr:hypothetical protein [Mycobacterium xenopi]SPX78011.1 Uncharacterised protein [Mycobacterium xenopi]